MANVPFAHFGASITLGVLKAKCNMRVTIGDLVFFVWVVAASAKKLLLV
jgi:hypothetical protein